MGMQFGIFSVGDVTMDPTTERKFSGNDRCISGIPA